MRHVISILLEDRAGALSRVASMFSTRGYNIESLNVAPTREPLVSRLTLVTRGSDDVIRKISKQLEKLVDVVTVVEMTDVDHVERELALLKVEAPEDTREALASRIREFGGHVLGYDEGHGTLELIGNGVEIDHFVADIADLAVVESLARSGPIAMAKGSPVLGAK